MTADPHLFRPLQLRGLTLANRVVVSPMCQYSAVDGVPQDWHFQHLGSLASSGPGLVMVEATWVEAIGRITPGCTGIYSDASEAVFTHIVKAVKSVAPVAVGIQLAHAGRKASCSVPWRGGGGPLPVGQGDWETVSASAMPFDKGWHTPRAATRADMDRITAAFVAAAGRALRAGFDLIEIHSAHGYLMHEFLSPLSNKRSDAYGGGLENRMRFPLEVIAAVRAAWPQDKPLGMRVSATDWVEGGLTVDEVSAYVARAKELGLDYVCVSSGANVSYAKIPVGPGFQVPLAEKIKRETGIVTRAVGLIVAPRQAEAIIASGQADQVALARAFLDDPRWVWRATAELGATAFYPPQYLRVAGDKWPGAAIRQKMAAE